MQKQNKKLLFSVTKKDLNITYFSGSGAGGQHRNRHNNCVRIHHPNSGVTVQATESKSLGTNKKVAFKRLTENKKFKAWLSAMAHYIDNDEIAIETMVDDLMNESNLKIEVRHNGRWVEE